MSLRPHDGSGWGAPSEGDRIFGFAPVSAHLPAGLVRDPVMVSAQERKIFDVGRTAGIPVVDVVGVAPGDGSAASGEYTPAVAYGECPALVGAGITELAAHSKRITSR